VEYEALTLSLYGDYLPVLRNQRKAILEESNNEAGIQRYRAALGKTHRLLKKLEPFEEKEKDEKPIIWTLMIQIAQIKNQVSSQLPAGH
jgi:hypothetical protein